MKLVRFLLALVLVPLPFGLVSGLAPTVDAPDCSVAKPTTTVPVEDVSNLLDELHASYDGLEGFIDVYYYPGDPVEFRPMFVGAVPAAAHDVETSVPVAFDVIESTPDPMGPGLAPSSSDLLCSGIRPGSKLLIGAGVCTANFVFTDPGGTLYLGTAGHCTLAGDSVTVANVGVVGTTVFSTGDGGVGDDFALIEIDAAHEGLVNPEICDWAGPTGVFAGPGIANRRLLHTGHGYGVAPSPLVSHPPRPKEGIGSGWGATSFTWAGTPWPGDSGSAIRLDGGTSTATIGTQGPGVGILTHGIGVSVVGAPAGLGWGTRLDKAIQMTGISGLQLVTVGYTHVM